MQCYLHYKTVFTGAPSNLYDETNPDWAPSQQLGHTKLKTARSSPRKSTVRYQRKVQRCERAADISTAKILLEMRANIDPAPEEAEDIGASSQQSPVAADNESKCVCTQTETTSDDIRNLQQQFNIIMAEKVALEKNIAYNDHK
ncbi:hypothetical protein Pcinc_003393 [Petrolisthes cinctipes]|uniref:Uncharacterized protein n=1 Tax=Petrolisthes cinctipes TaxID=88211 RepID=A0AAE1GJ16_PETCI|nr:hypothetical protein Pcinc_003393 [Petrolisthes cinctipes]